MVAAFPLSFFAGIAGFAALVAALLLFFYWRAQSGARDVFFRSYQTAAAGVYAIPLAAVSGYAAVWVCAALLFTSWGLTGHARLSVVFEHLVSAGLPVYHAPQAPERIAGLYGPAGIWLNSVFVRGFSDSLFASYASGFVVFLLQIAMTLAVFWRRFPARIAWPAFALLLYLYLTTWSNTVDGMNPFGAYMYLGVIFCMVAAAFPGNRIAAAGLAAVGGFLAFWCKPHAILGVLPFLPMILSRLGVRLTLASFAGFLILTLLIFAHPSFSLENFLFWITAAAKHNLLWENTHPMLLIGLLGLIVGAARLAEGRLRWHFPRWRMAALEWSLCLLALLLVSYPAAKNGAGARHILLVFPALMFFLCEWQVVSEKAQPQKIGRSNKATKKKPQAKRGFALDALPKIALIAFFTFPPIYFEYFHRSPFSLFRVVNQAQSYWSQRENFTAFRRHVREDLSPLLDGLYVNAAAGGNVGIPYLMAQTYLTSPEKKVFTIPFMLADMRLAGLDWPPASAEFLRSQAIDAFVTPRGASPMSAIYTGYVPPVELFTDEIREAFMGGYVKIEGFPSQVYDLWIARDRAVKIAERLRENGIQTLAF